MAAPLKKDGRLLKNDCSMKNHNRDLLVLYKSGMGKESLEATVECLHRILRQVECLNVFCGAHELAKRTRITHKRSSLLRAIEHAELKPFHFLINKN